MSKGPSAKQAFEEGDYRTARARAAAIMDDSDATKKAKEGAQKILQKTSPPSLAKYIFLLAAVLLVLLSVFWIGEGKRHHDDPAAPPASSDKAP